MAMNTNTANIFITATDKTKAAFSSISQGLNSVKGYALAAGAALAAISYVGLEKYAKLNEFAKFDIGTNEALQYADSLKVVGIEMDSVNDMFSELSKKVTEALSDDGLKNIFKQVGIDAKSLKSENISGIFDKVMNNIDKVKDKATRVKIMDELFADNGVKLLDSSVDERFNRIKDRAKEFANEQKAVSYGAQEMYRNFAEIKDIIINDVANAFASVLPIVNTWLETIIDSRDRLTEVRTQAEILGEVDTFKDLSIQTIRFANFLNFAFQKGVDGTVMFKDALINGLMVIKTFGDGIRDIIMEPLKGYAKMQSQILDAAKSALTGNIDEAKNHLSKAFTFDFSKGFKSFENNMDKLSNQSVKTGQSINKLLYDVPDMLLDEAKFTETLSKQKQKTDEAMNKVLNKNGTKRKPIEPQSGAPELQANIKALEKFNEKSQYLLSMQDKDNELSYQNRLVTIDEYYQKKNRIAEQSYMNNKEILNAELELVNNFKPKDKNEQVSKNEQINDLKLKILKNEMDYGYAVKETNSKAEQEKLALLQLQIDTKKQILQLEEDELNFYVSKGSKGLFETNQEIIKLREKQVQLSQDDIDLLEKKAKRTPEEEVKLKKAKLELIKFKDEIDPIATEINKTVNSSFEGFFKDVVTGTKSIKDAFKDMLGNINSMILDMIAKDLGTELMRSLFKDQSSSGGFGGFISSLMGTGKVSGGSGGGIFDSIIDWGSNLFRANGGSVMPNGINIVGENGPELLFTGNTGGYVANNHDSKRLLGGSSGDVYITMNVNTNDANSFNHSRQQIIADIRREIYNR